ncbi:MAG: ATP-dependent helicase C-terminal domain-containing protein [Vicinamibacterales bacterium]
MTPLPVDAHVPALRAALAEARAAVLTAAPGAGKTTRVPPALVDRGPVLLLQPRRVAARAVARRIAEERGWTLGAEIGWQMRLDRRFAADTRLLVVTEGILTARLQQDPLISGFATVVLDEFHERSIHADLGLALVREAWRARDDLHVVVMSATMDDAPVSRFLGGCPVLDVPGAPHPLALEYAPGVGVADAVRGVLPRTPGQVLVFLPGAREIARAESDLAGLAAAGVEVVPLHGGLEGERQDRAVSPARGRRVILATNIAETSLTVPGVTAVIDTGLQKIARDDPSRGVDSLATERVTRDAADQRAGRAARLGPGLAVRLWDARDHLRPHREPDVARVDLAGPVLELLAWGADPFTFEWFEKPTADRIAAAMTLLARLGAVEPEEPEEPEEPQEPPSRPRRITELGRLLARLPLHPRLARLLVAAGGAFEAAAACAVLGDAGALAPRGAATTCDLLAVIDEWRRVPPHLARVAEALQRAAATALGAEARARVDEAGLRRAIFAGYPDRLALRRAPGDDRFTLASGHGARLARESGVRDAMLVVALDVTAGRRDGHAEALIRAASAVDPDWVAPTAIGTEHAMSGGVVRAARVARYGALRLRVDPCAPDPAARAALLAEAWLARPLDERTARLVARARFAGHALDLPALACAAADGAKDLEDLDIRPWLPHNVARDIDRLAPESLPVPSGRAARLEYDAHGRVAASVKLQELFGLADTPRLGPRQVPITFHLLAPNGRPVQTTDDLRSFWDRTYAEVRKELRGRYPKHPWPDDPWTAQPTARTTRRRGEGSSGS